MVPALKFSDIRSGRWPFSMECWLRSAFRLACGVGRTSMHAYQAVVAHWADRDGCCLHAVQLSLHRFRGAHSGLNQAHHLWRAITDYGIAPFVRMINVDNASKNDTALVVLAERLRSAGHPSFGPVADRLRCFGHAINLAVKRILWGTDVEAYEGALPWLPPSLPDIMSECSI